MADYCFSFEIPFFNRFNYTFFYVMLFWLITLMFPMSEIRLGVIFMFISCPNKFQDCFISSANLVKICATEVAFCSSYFQKIFSKTQIIGNNFSKEPLTAFAILFSIVSVFNQTKSLSYVQSFIKCSVKICPETLKNYERKNRAQG